MAEVADWVALKRSLSRDAFAAKHLHPFLIRREEPKETDDEVAERLSFKTGVVDLRALQSAAAALGKIIAVLPIVKKPSNPFPDRISVGRAQNCDVVIRDASVSKLHAEIRMPKPAECEIADLKSANGTRLNGKPIAGLPSIRVRSGDKLDFGAVTLQLVEAKRLWDLL